MPVCLRVCVQVSQEELSDELLQQMDMEVISLQGELEGEELEGEPSLPLSPSYTLSLPPSFSPLG